jgi:hypothetical protein
MKNTATTEELGQMLLSEAQRMSPDEKAKLRQRLQREFGQRKARGGDILRLQ